MNENSNFIERIVIEQSLIFCRDCYRNMFVLTSIVASLNLGTIAAFLLLLKFGGVESSGMDCVERLFIFIFGVLIAVFGYIFNKGAFKACQQLLNKLEVTTKCIEEMVQKDDTILLKFLEIPKFERKKLFKYTNIFFNICCIIWVFLGVAVIFYSLGFIFG